MWSSNREVAAGDTVIIWLTRDNLYPLLIDPNGKDLNTKFGNFRHADLVGVPYGSKLAAKHTGKNATRPSSSHPTSSTSTSTSPPNPTPPAPRGFIHILRPTPELWTLALPHRTQILYLADIAFVCAWLGVRPGSRVVEAGTGSGSFSHSVARAVRGGVGGGKEGGGKEGRGKDSGGRLWSYEFHEARYLKAKEEFARHGMSDVVTLQHRNVCKDGFTNVDEIDAVFLDLPAPWEAVEHAKKALRKDRPARICCFSPCIEQVLRTVAALNSAGFSEITMHEVLLRPVEVFQTPPLPGVAGLAEKLKRQEVRREEKRVRQVEQNRAGREREREARERERERKRKAGEVGVGLGVDAAGIAEKVEQDREEEDREEGSSKKRVKMGTEAVEDADETAAFAIREEDMVDMLDEDDEDADAEGDMDMDMDVDVPASITATSAQTTTTSTTTSVLSTSASTNTSNGASTNRSANANVNDTASASARALDASTIPQPSTATAARRLLRTLEGSARINVSKALPEVRGHTSYLTFACLVPRPGWKAAQAARAVEVPGPETETETEKPGGGAGVNGASTPTVPAVEGKGKGMDKMPEDEAQKSTTA